MLYQNNYETNDFDININVHKTETNDNNFI